MKCLRIMFTYKRFKDAYKLEHELHELFKNKRIKGEWFNLNEEDLVLLADKLRASI